MNIPSAERTSSRRVASGEKSWILELKQISLAEFRLVEPRAWHAFSGREDWIELECLFLP